MVSAPKRKRRPLPLAEVPHQIEDDADDHWELIEKIRQGGKVESNTLGEVTKSGTYYRDDHD